MNVSTNITVVTLTILDIVSENDSNGEINFSNDTNDTSPQFNDCFEVNRLEPVSDTRLQVFIFILYLVTIILSVLGNAIVLLVAAFGCQKFFSYVSGQASLPHSSSSSRSIRRYLANLAVSDITLALMSMPFTYSNVVIGHWDWPHYLCPVAQFAQLLTSFTTSSTLTIIGVERYIVTLHPLSCASSWLKSHANWLLAFSWALGSIYAYMPIGHTYVVAFLFNNEVYYKCVNSNEISPVKLRAIVLFNFLFTFFLPMVIITAAYAAIIRRLKRRRRLLQLQKMAAAATGGGGSCAKRSFSAAFSNANKQQHRRQQQQHQQQLQQQRSSDQSGTSTSTGLGRASGGGVAGGGTAVVPAVAALHSGDDGRGRMLVCCYFSANRSAGTTSTFSSSLPIERQTKTIKMIFIVILIYCICLLPLKTLQLLVNFELITICSEEEFTIMFAVYITFHWMAMANSFVNPIIYSYLSSSFRNDFAKMLAHFSRKRNGQEGGNTNADGVVAGRWS